MRSRQSSPVQAIPADTLRVARAAFPPGHASLPWRDALGPIVTAADFAPLFPSRGQPGLAPWRRALGTLLQWRAPLADRHAAAAVRARIAWKARRGLKRTAPGCACSVRRACRDRGLAGSAAERLCASGLERWRTLGRLKARGQQRTDSTHGLAARRGLRRLACVAETLRAALNDRATVAPDGLPGRAPLEGDER